MRHRTILIAVLATLFVCAFQVGGAVAASSPRPIVYSQRQWSPVDADAGGGGLFAVQNGHERQLTDVPADREPSVSRDGATVVFARDGDIYSVRADGFETRHLTEGPGIDERPLVSPNGRYVLFSRRDPATPQRDLYTVGIHGTNPRQLTATREDDREAAFSPDGRALVFLRRLTRADGRVTDDLFSIRSAGSGLTQLTRTRQYESHPHYLASAIVFDRRRLGPGNRHTVFTMRRDGSGAKPVFASGRVATTEAVSADGRLLLFSDARGLWFKRFGKGGGAPRRLAASAGAGMVFSPNGREVAGVFRLGGGIFSFASIDVASGRRTGESPPFELEAPGPVQRTIDPTIAW